MRARKIIKPESKGSHFLRNNLLPGKIYPTVNVSYQQFNSVILPKNYKRFVVIRDLRDALISLYFSLKVSHTLASSSISESRNALLQFESIEEGLMYLIDKKLWLYARFQHSWLKSGEKPIRYEDLLKNDIGILTPPLLSCVSLSEDKVKEIIISNRFENITQGRPRGQEDIYAHERKALPGDWKNYFTKAIEKEIENKFGDLLVSAGYKRKSLWKWIGVVIKPE